MLPKIGAHPVGMAETRHCVPPFQPCLRHGVSRSPQDPASETGGLLSRVPTGPFSPTWRAAQADHSDGGGEAASATEREVTCRRNCPVYVQVHQAFALFIYLSASIRG